MSYDGRHAGDPVDPVDTQDVIADADPGDEHEGRRNVLLGVGLSVVAVLLVGAMFWVMSSLTRPAVSGTATVRNGTTTTVPTADAAPAPTPTTTFVPPSGTWTPSVTATLPPPEQPTMTVPVVTVTSAPEPVVPPAPTSAAPPPPPATTPPPPPSTPAPAPGVSNVKLTCSKDKGNRITAKLSFATGTRISVTVGAGSTIQNSQAGPGDATVTASGRGAEVCFARVGDQTVGPIPAQ